ncbi:MAG: hypothetical protein J6T62_12015, partial [Fibrobacter sp.]|nr:hypothetical protein [Fibrobacter sp.]
SKILPLVGPEFSAAYYDHSVTFTSANIIIFDLRTKMVHNYLILESPIPKPPGHRGRAGFRTGNGTIIEPILTILESCIYLVFRRMCDYYRITLTGWLVVDTPWV